VAAGHQGYSTVTATAHGSGVRVDVRGRDAGEQRAAVHAKAKDAVRIALKGQSDDRP